MTMGLIKIIPILNLHQVKILSMNFLHICYPYFSYIAFLSKTVDSLETISKFKSNMFWF